MQWFSDIFMSHSALQAVIIISIIIAVGLALGKIRVWGISLGVTFVFFAGILAGHIGLSIDPTILHYTENLGLVLFVYELGLKVGPGFFSSFRKGGMQLNLLGLGVIVIGTLMAVLFSIFLGVPIGEASGSALRSDDQHPGSRCGTAGTRTARTLSQRCGPQLRSHISTRCRRRDSRHNSPAQGTHQAGNTALV